MRTSRHLLFLTSVWFTCLTLPVVAQLVLQSGAFGGSMPSTDGVSSVTGTIGQAIIGPTASSTRAAGQGFWYTLPYLGTSGVTGITKVAVAGVVLYQNIPNPCSSTTAVAFDLPKGGPVSLRIFDALGNLVRTVVDETRDAGRSTVTINTEYIESGYYSVQLAASGVTRTITMVVVR